MKQLIGFVFSLSILSFFILSFISSAPTITIYSPQNITYNSTKIPINVTSNEPVDFFIRNEKTGKVMVLARNTTKLENSIYARIGTYDFTIQANNSGGESSETIVFSTSAHNPISITECGWLYSSDTKYVLEQDIQDEDTGTCLWIYHLRNITFDLNGHTVRASNTYPYTRRAIAMSYVSNSQMYNGTVKSNAAPYIGPYGQCYPEIAFVLDISKTRFSNMKIEGFLGADVWSLNEVSFENVTINSSIGIWYYLMKNTQFINSSFIWNGEDVCYGMNSPTTAFCDQSTYSEIFLERTNITGFPENDFYLDNTLTDIYLRNTNINLSKIRYSDYVADARIYTQHLLVINVTDQFNKTGSGVIEIEDNGIFERKTGLESLNQVLSNPTAHLLVATNDEGEAAVWVTEKLTYAKSSSPAVVEEFDFSLYNLTAKTWDTNETIPLNLTGHHSTIPVIFKIQTLAPEELPECAMNEMLDLNHDEEINIQDAIIVLRKIAGLPISANSTRECKGITFNPF